MTVLVLGVGLSGIAAARLARSLGHDIVFYDERPDATLPDEFRELPITPGAWSNGLLDRVDLVITSPGFPPSSPPIAAALDLGVPVTTEVGYALDQMDVPYLAVTGTNGKSTITEAAAAMLKASGVRAEAAGNIGVPVADLFNADLEILVVELSSFQLHFWQPSPVAAALANIAPDHLDWHGTFDRYVAAKAKVGAGLGVNGVLAYNADDATVVAVVGASMARGVPCSGTRVPADGNGVAGDALVIGGSLIPHGIPDPSYRLDLVLAATIARVAGATDDAIASVVGAFAPGEHRRRVVGVVDGVAWIDDSKATNPHAAVAAAASYPSVRLLAGGRNKALDLSPIGSVSSVRHLYAFGEAGPDIAATASVPVTVHVSMLDAMAAARTDAVSGDVVLLSPGCTSFDEFTSYAERGTVFAETVLSMVGGDMR